MPWQTLRECETKGSARGGQSNLETPWITCAYPDELKPLREFRSAKFRGILGDPQGLTTPEPRTLR